MWARVEVPPAAHSNMHPSLSSTALTCHLLTRWLPTAPLAKQVSACPPVTARAMLPAARARAVHSGSADGATVGAVQ
eukprot:2089239-Prymnesium_polylepis.1